MGKPRFKQLDRRVLLALTGLVLVGALATGAWILHEQHNTPASGGPDILAPSGTLHRYTNPVFDYTVQYPAEWGLNVSDDKTYMNVYVRVAQGGPGLPGFEITCARNPSGFNAQQWWQIHASPDNHESPAGFVALVSGAQAYKSTGQGSQPYELYTIVHGDKACQIENDEHGTVQVTQQAETAINSFRWT